MKQDQISFATTRAGVIKYKIVFVGDQGVGKSSIISRYIKNQFDTNHNPTIGIDFISKNLNINGKTIRLQLWDTAGQERFRSLIPGYLKDCNAALVIFDMTSTTSFQSIDKWIDFVRESRGSDVLIYLIGNKMDLQYERVVKRETVEEFAKEQGIHYYQVSAKNGTNLNDIFNELCNNLLVLSNNANEQKTVQQKKIQNKTVVTTLKNTNKKIGPEQIKQKSCC